MLEISRQLSPFSRVVVTGPQRSGTRITSKMIAYDLDRPWVQEEEFGVDDVVRFCTHIYQTPCVIQAPAVSYMVHGLTRKDVAVVFMRRPLQEILESERRIRWSHGDYELTKNFRREGHPALAKEKNWEFQRFLLGTRAFDMHFSELVGHEMYVEPNKRAAFSHNQTTQTTRHKETSCRTQSY